MTLAEKRVWEHRYIHILYIVFLSSFRAGIARIDQNRILAILSNLHYILSMKFDDVTPEDKRNSKKVYKVIIMRYHSLMWDTSTEYLLCAHIFLLTVATCWVSVDVSVRFSLNLWTSTILSQLFANFLSIDLISSRITGTGAFIPVAKCLISVGVSVQFSLNLWAYTVHTHRPGPAATLPEISAPSTSNDMPGSHRQMGLISVT